MTRDRGPAPPYHETWPPPSPQPYYGNGIVGELRERVRELETMLPLLKEMAIDRFSTQAKRIDGVDERLKSGDSRMDGIETRLTTAEQASAPVPSLTARVDAIERRWAGWKAGLQYAVSAILFGLVVAGKMTWPEAVSVLRLFMPWLGG